MEAKPFHLAHEALVALEPSPSWTSGLGMNVRGKLSGVRWTAKCGAWYTRCMCTIGLWTLFFESAIYQARGVGTGRWTGEVDLKVSLRRPPRHWGPFKRAASRTSEPKASNLPVLLIFFPWGTAHLWYGGAAWCLRLIVGSRGSSTLPRSRFLYCSLA
jgi:hypothetical protein